MKILIYDKMQIANGAPDEIKSPALSDVYTDDTEFSITFDTAQKINCVGIGYTDATELEISNGHESEIITISKSAPYQNGLYLIDEFPADEYADSFTISHNGTYIGRVGLGEYRTLNTAPSKEPGFYTTNESRDTLSGQIIPGAGGYTGRRIDLDVRYEIDDDVWADIQNAYPLQISKSFPFFLCLDDELHKLNEGYRYFYAKLSDPGIVLQSSTYKYLYSYKFSFVECF